MENNDSVEANSLPIMAVEVKSTTLYAKNDSLRQGGFAEGNASNGWTEDVESRETDVEVAEKEIFDIPSTLKTEQEKDDHVQETMLLFQKAGVKASHVLISEDINRKMDLIVTERDNENLLCTFDNDQKEDDSVDRSIQKFSTTESSEEIKADIQKEDLVEHFGKFVTSNVCEEGTKVAKIEKIAEVEGKTIDCKELSSGYEEKVHEDPDEANGVEDSEPVFDGTELPGMTSNRNTSSLSLDPDSDSQGFWPEKAVSVKNFVREKSAVAVSTVVCRLSGRSDDVAEDNPDEEVKGENSESVSKELPDTPKESETKGVIEKSGERAGWNPISLIGISWDADVENKAEKHVEVTEESLLLISMKGIILLYTRLGCNECNEARTFLRRKKLRYVEINIDVYPSRKLELEKISGSPSVPKVYFNEILVGGMSEMKSLDEVGKLDEKIEYVVMEAPPYEAPLPPLSGEDDMSTSGVMDELAVMVRKMQDTIIVKDRFYKLRRFTSCFLGSEAVDFLSEDQYLERGDAVDFGRKLANGLFFQHVLEENIFEDGNHLYRFLDQDPIVMTQCYNIPRGIIEVKPKRLTEISSRLRFLSYAILEAYTSEDGRHVDYRNIHGSEEFARYLRIIEELQRVDLNDMPREEKLAFFINLFNMMVIHAILILGYPSGALERRKMLGDFKYIIGGCTYSLSAIQNGILRGNQRPPYNLTKPFGLKDKGVKVALPYAEPLIHFALVFGNRSGPPLRFFSPGDVDKELMEAARDFIRSGGLIVDLNMKVTSVTKILKWYSIDFGKNEVEVLKHAANYLEPVDSEAMLELLATTQVKVVYQPYDWGLNI